MLNRSDYFNFNTPSEKAFSAGSFGKPDIRAKFTASKP